MVVSVQEWLNSPKPELADATNFQEETTDRDPPDTTYNNLEESHGPDNFSQHISNHTPVHHSMGQHQNNSRHTIDSKQIHQLEEDWDNGQFAQIQTIMGHHQGDCRLNLMTPLVIILHSQTQQTFSAGMHMEEENTLFSTDIDFSVKRPNQWKAGKPEKDYKTISSK